MNYLRIKNIFDVRSKSFRATIFAQLLFLFIFTLSQFHSSNLFADDGSNSGRVELSLNPPSIYEGESTTLTVAVVNMEPDQEPGVKNLESDFDVKPMGASNYSNVSVVYQNSIPKRVETKSINYRYVLTPKKTGSITIDSPSILVGGKPVTAESIVLTVQESTSTNLVLLESSVSSDEVYPLVPFEVSVDVLVKEAPEKYQEIDLLREICTQLGVPQLSIPWLQSNVIVSNTINDQELEDWLNQLHNKQAGFALNKFQLSRDPFDFGFSFFDEPRAATFLPKPERVEREDSAGTKAYYQKYSFKRKLRAQSPTTLKFAPSSLKGQFIDFSDLDNIKSETVYLSTKPLTVTIKSIPEDSAPDNYVGVYGKIQQTVYVSSSDVAKGDAFTLSLELRGFGAFDGAQAPDIASLLARDANFKSYPASERSLEDGVAFDYKVRPLKQGKQVVPSVKTSFFDVETGKFVEEASEPIEINVRESLLSQSEAETSDAQADQNDDAKVTSDRQNKGFEKERRNTKLALEIVLGFVVLGVLYLLFLGVRKLVKINNERIAVGNKRIVENARSRLDAGLEQMSRSPSEGVQTLRLAFVQLIGKRFTQAVEALTDAEIVTFFDSELSEAIPSLLKQNRPQDERQRQDERQTLSLVREFFLNAEQIRFGGVLVQDPNFAENVKGLFQKWVELLGAHHKKLANIASVPNDK